jgi:hypothetical protein
MSQTNTNEKKQPAQQPAPTKESAEVMIAAENRKPTESAGSNLAPQIVVTPL